MPFFPPEEVAKAREMDLLTYLEQYEPDQLVHVGGRVYCTREHDSLKISNGKWCWWSRGIGGRSALDYLIKVQGMDFLAAVERILGYRTAEPANFKPRAAPEQTEEPRELKLPPVNRYADAVVQYLSARGIDGELISECIHAGKLYESRGYHNAVFVGMTPQGEVKQAYLCGLYDSPYRRDADGSDKRYSFFLPAAVPSDTVHVFESAVDTLSYATMLKLAGRDYHRENLLALSGVYLPKENMAKTTLPLALDQYLKDHPGTKTVALHLDNDKAGRLATETVKVLLIGRCKVEDEPPRYGKDVNESLCIHLGIPVMHRKERKKTAKAQKAPAR